MKRVILIVMDSLGVGYLPDAYKFGDETADTFGHIVNKMGSLEIPNFKKLGFCNIDGVLDGKLAVEAPKGSFGRLMEKSVGKDTITGHWEIAGIETAVPFPTYADGFPKAFMDEFEKEIGIGTLGNKIASGTEIIEELGDEHEATGMPIIYTSHDSVFQVAANTDVIPLERLYEICEIARKLLTGDVNCGRVIARPYIKVDGKRKRTSDRKDYAVSPAGETVLDKVKNAGKRVYTVGKISNIFNQCGVTDSVHTDNNMDGVDKTLEAMKLDFEGFIFTNLVDFDSEYGHRRNIEGYGKAIEELDARIPELIANMKEGDVLMFTADHGNDPSYTGFDHTREYIPFIAYGNEIKEGVNIGTRDTFADIGATIADMLEVETTEIGTSFKELVSK